MKARLLAFAAGLAGLVPIAAGAQGYTAYVPAVSQEQIAVNVRAAGFAPLSRPALRGAVYYLRAMGRGNVEMRVAVDARSGRVLSATRVSDTQRAAAQSPVPDAPPRYEPRVRGSGYSETAPLPPADVPVASEPAPGAPSAAPPPSARKLAAQPARTPLARGPGASAAAAPDAGATSANATPATSAPAASESATPNTDTSAVSASAAPAAPAGEVTGAVPGEAAKPPADLRPAIPATPAPAKPPAVTMVPIAPLE
ncbi:MAG: hypothetical protein JO228_05100 [Xanthobacteraceae bacterium]|nr:hypothetical protein [Xanthobacteraceae bacterium]